MSFENLISTLIGALEKNTEELQALSLSLAKVSLPTSSDVQPQPDKKTRSSKKEPIATVEQEQPKPEPVVEVAVESVAEKVEVVEQKSTVSEKIQAITFTADQLKALAFKVRDHENGGMDMAKEVIREVGYKQLSEVKQEDYQKLGEKLSAKLEFLDNLTIDEGL